MTSHKVLYLDDWGELIGGGQHSLLDIVRKRGRLGVDPVVVCGSEGSLVQALRDEGDESGARQLLYEVLTQGNEKQVEVARNILRQLDQG